MTRKSFNPSIYFIADPECCGGRDVADVVMAAVEGGVTMVQYRNKSGDMSKIAAEAAMLAELLKPLGVPFLVNDYVEIARDVEADGVHIGQGDMDPVEARRILGERAIVGLTAFTAAQIEAISAYELSRRKPGSGRSYLPDPGFRRDDGKSYVVDYIGTGPVYPTKTDKGKPVLGVEGFSELVKLSPVPVVGIGGITPSNAGDVLEAGAAGVAMMRSVSEAEDVRAAAERFKNAPKAS